MSNIFFDDCCVMYEQNYIDKYILVSKLFIDKYIYIVLVNINIEYDD